MGTIRLPWVGAVVMVLHHRRDSACSILRLPLAGIHQAKASHPDPLRLALDRGATILSPLARRMYLARMVGRYRIKIGRRPLVQLATRSLAHQPSRATLILSWIGITWVTELCGLLREYLFPDPSTASSPQTLPRHNMRQHGLRSRAPRDDYRLRRI